MVTFNIHECDVLLNLVILVRMRDIYAFCKFVSVLTESIHLAFPKHCVCVCVKGGGRMYVCMRVLCYVRGC